MRFNSGKYHRRSIRLPGYDYSQAGAYFVTLVAQNRASVFGRVSNGIMELNDAGRMIQSEWIALLDRFPGIELDENVVMPNHFHGIIAVGATLVVAPNEGVVAPNEGVVAPNEGVVAPKRDVRAGTGTGAGMGAGTGAGTSPAPTLGAIIGAFKSITTNQYIRGVDDLGWPQFDRRLWQRNYYEHIIRDERDWDAIRSYILNNPLQWESDNENPDR